MGRHKILVCDDEIEILRYVKKLLEGRGFAVETFLSGEPLVQRLKEGLSAELLLQDVRMPGIDGLQIFRQVKRILPNLPVIIMTAYGSIDAAVQAIKLGAYDYITKPFPKEKLLGVVAKSLEREILLKENRHLREELHGPTADRAIVFRSGKMREVHEFTLRVAASHSNVLILGESGTGKELTATAVHQNSPRHNAPFSTLNCAALTESLLESQLFGHLRGAFTGAFASQKGMLEEADGGTLFLDEIGDMSLAVQAKLLRVIQEKTFIPVGSTKPKSVDVRFVAATNKDLKHEISQGRFREDLYYRLNVVTIRIPPLRERPEDIEPLAMHFLSRFTQLMRNTVTVIADDALKLLTEYHWPGNARELENVMERAVILAPHGVITAEMLPIPSDSLSAARVVAAGDVSLQSLERAHIAQILAANDFHKSRCAALLGISRKTLDRKIAEYGLVIPAPPR